MPRKKGRGRGKGNPPGVTKKEILRLILNNPSGIAEPEIREHLWKKYLIGDDKGVKDHLKELKEEIGLPLRKIGKSGGANVWILIPDLQKLIDLLDHDLLKGLEVDIIRWLAERFNSKDSIKDLPVKEEELFTWIQAYLEIVRRFSNRREVLDLLSSKLSVTLLTTVLDEIRDKISEDQDRYLKRLAFLALISPSSYLAIIEFFLYPEMRLSHIDWHRLLLFLGIKELRVVDPVEDFLKTEMGILLYSAIRKDLSSGILDVKLLRVWMTEETARELEAYTSIDRRTKVFQKMKKALAKFTRNDKVLSIDNIKVDGPDITWLNDLAHVVKLSKK
jgi:hypothetical protein